MTIVYVPGCFDLLHSGHRNLLRRSKELDDDVLLVAGVVSDDGAALYKRRPVQSERERMGNVGDLRYVDRVILQPTTDPTPILELLNLEGLCPRYLVHGDDWSRLLAGNETLDRLEIKLILLPYTQGISTSLIRERMAG